MTGLALDAHHWLREMTSLSLAVIQMFLPRVLLRVQLAVAMLSCVENATEKPKLIRNDFIGINKALHSALAVFTGEFSPDAGPGMKNKCELSDVLAATEEVPCHSNSLFILKRF